MKIYEPGIKLLSDIEFVEKRIQEQHEYLRTIRARARYKRGYQAIRCEDIIKSAQERLEFFQQIQYLINSRK